MPKKALLAKYNAKRDFKKTAEPSGKLKRSKAGNSYLIQKHAATRLHYDFRLELDDVLKSWAVTRGPSLDPHDRRLAVEVEDHPVAYGTFEGIIPKGQYGGGTVMMWDTGTWEPIGDPHKMLAKGHLSFKLQGKRLKGEWALIRMKPRPQDKGRNNWLLIKKEDEYSKFGDNDKLLAKENFSIVSKRSMEKIAAQKTKTWQSNRAEDTSAEEPKKLKKKALKAPSLKLKGKKLPDFVPPQLATLSDSMPQGDKWVHEVKFDGYRTQARIEVGKVKMLTRTGLNWTSKFSALAKELKKLNVQTALLDGEIVAIGETGNSSFMELQKALKDEKDEELQYYVFDILHLNGEDLMPLPLLERKERLKELLAQKKLHNIFYSEHFASDGQNFYQQACKLHLEGVISKRVDEPYRKGRGREWLKSKCHQRQEFVIGGYTLPSNGMAGIGALLLGYYEDGKLIYASKCGTGYDSETSRLLRKKLEKLEQKQCSFERVTPIGRRGARWVKPILVCEIEFTEWTDEGSLRHPSFQGLREDKPAKSVKRDHAIDPKGVKVRPPVHASRIKSENKILEIAGIKISHPERVVFPKPGYTKGDLAEYYAKVADYILPYIENRLLSGIRCQDNVNGACFFQRHAGTHNSPHFQGLKVKGHGDNEPYMAIKDIKGLISLAQIGVVEIHPWGSTVKDVYKPDRIIFDFDPDSGLDWKHVVAAAAELRERMTELGFESFLKTTGGKGLHVTVPFKPKYEWDVMKPWAKAVAESMVKDSPSKYTANMSKAGRKGKIFIDYLRNGLTATAVAAYSARARELATVAMPIAWKDLNIKLDPKKYDIKTVPEILARQKSDPWKNFYTSKQVMTASILKTFS